MAARRDSPGPPALSEPLLRVLHSAPEAAARCGGAYAASPEARALDAACYALEGIARATSQRNVEAIFEALLGAFGPLSALLKHHLALDVEATAPLLGFAAAVAAATTQHLPIYASRMLTEASAQLVASCAPLDTKAHQLNAFWPSAVRAALAAAWRAAAARGSMPSCHGKRAGGWCLRGNCRGPICGFD